MVDIKDFGSTDDILELLEVELFGLQSPNQVQARFKNNFSLLNEMHQRILKEIANNVTKLQDLEMFSVFTTWVGWSLMMAQLHFQ